MWLILKQLETYFGFTLGDRGRLWEHFGVTWHDFSHMMAALEGLRGHLWHLKVALGPLWGHFGITYGIWGALWAHSGITLGSL